MNMDKQVFDSIKKTLAVTLPKRAIALLYGSQASRITPFYHNVIKDAIVL
jgi:hypothetical protein